MHPDRVFTSVLGHYIYHVNLVQTASGNTFLHLTSLTITFNLSSTQSFTGSHSPSLKRCENEIGMF